MPSSSHWVIVRLSSTHCSSQWLSLPTVPPSDSEFWFYPLFLLMTLEFYPLFLPMTLSSTHCSSQWPWVLYQWFSEFCTLLRQVTVLSTVPPSDPLSSLPVTEFYPLFLPVTLWVLYQWLFYPLFLPVTLSSLPVAVTQVLPAVPPSDSKFSTSDSEFYPLFLPLPEILWWKRS